MHRGNDLSLATGPFGLCFRLACDTTRTKRRLGFRGLIGRACGENWCHWECWERLVDFFVTNIEVRNYSSEEKIVIRTFIKPENMFKMDKKWTHATKWRLLHFLGALRRQVGGGEEGDAHQKILNTYLMKQGRSQIVSKRGEGSKFEFLVTKY